MIHKHRGKKSLSSKNRFKDINDIDWLLAYNGKFDSLGIKMLGLSNKEIRRLCEEGAEAAYKTLSSKMPGLMYELLFKKMLKHDRTEGQKFSL